MPADLPPPARAGHAAGRIDEAGLRRVEQESILVALSVQRDSGIGVHTDGEYPRTDFMSRLTEHVDGCASEVQGNPLTWDDQRRKLDLTVAVA